MRTFLLRVLAFAMLLVVSHVALIALATIASPSLKATLMRNSNVPMSVERDHIALRFEELQGVRDIDVLFIGSSHSLRTFDPRYFERQGIRAFNLGTANQTPLNTYYLLRRYLPQLKPRVVVIEAYWETLAINGVEGTIFITGNRGPGWDTWGMALATRHPMALNAQISSQIEQLLGRSTEVRMRPGDMYVSGGFVENWQPNRQAPPTRRRAVVLDDTQMSYLSRSLALLRDRQVKALLTWAPVTSAHRQAVTNLDEIESRLTDMSKAHEVPFIDLEPRVLLDERLDFRDADHLNQRGVDKVMPVVAEILSEVHLLGDEVSRAEPAR